MATGQPGRKVSSQAAEAKDLVYIRVHWSDLRTGPGETNSMANNTLYTVHSVQCTVYRPAGAVSAPQPALYLTGLTGFRMKE